MCLCDVQRCVPSIVGRGLGFWGGILSILRENSDVFFCENDPILCSFTPIFNRLQKLHLTEAHSLLPRPLPLAKPPTFQYRQTPVKDCCLMPINCLEKDWTRCALLLCVEIVWRWPCSSCEKTRLWLSWRERGGMTRASAAPTARSWRSVTTQFSYSLDPWMWCVYCIICLRVSRRHQSSVN